MEYVKFRYSDIDILEGKGENIHTRSLFSEGED
jgi:hypothetical protein